MADAPIGPRGLAVRCAAQGLDAARAGAPVTACPYPRTRPLARRAWVLGFTAELRDRGTVMPSDLVDVVDEDAPFPDEATAQG